MDAFFILSAPSGPRQYSREEYLKWCTLHGVKNPLPENRRNKFCISGYPVWEFGDKVF